MITLDRLTKTYGTTTAVDDLSLAIAPGQVTGFLGPNGAGKSTTMRMILGLAAPTSGTATIDGRAYAELRHPLREVGALLDATALHPGRTARSHLVAMARSNAIPLRRVDDVIEQVGLTHVAGKRAGQFSLGMGQRLGIAGALLGDPRVLMFDEPVNGLDPDGVLWIRGLMRSLAEEGRTVLVSSHLMSEMQQTADQLVVIGRGRLIADLPVEELIAGSSLSTVVVRLPDPGDRVRLHDALSGEADSIEAKGDGLVVAGLASEHVGDVAHRLGLRLHALHTRHASLEEAYMQLTADSLEFTTGTSDHSPRTPEGAVHP
ncbi:MAG: ABC transporter ATP-binding protein [Janibacter sp.]